MSAPNKPGSIPYLAQRLEALHDENEALRATLRDYFAGTALTGLLAEASHPDSLGIASHDFPSVAGKAYALADAMLDAREPTP